MEVGVLGGGGYKRTDWLLLCIDLKMETVLAEGGGVGPVKFLEGLGVWGVWGEDCPTADGAGLLAGGRGGGYCCRCCDRETF